MRTPKIILLVAVAAILSGAGFLMTQSNTTSAHNSDFSMPYAVSNVTHNPQSVGSLYSYIIGNTSETDGFPAYEGPGSSQNQSMPQYIIIAINPVGNTTSIIMMGNTVEYTGLTDSSNGPWLYPVFTNLTGSQIITISMHSKYLNQTVTDTYQVNFELVATFIHYEQQLHHITTSIGISGAALTAGGIFGILAVPLGFIHRSGAMIARFRRWFIDRWGN
jgi:hypothetical protein